MINNFKNIENILKNLDNLFNKGNYDHVISKTNKLIINFQKEIRLYNYLGLSYQKKNQLNNAINIFNKALEIDPKNSTIIINLANAYISSGNFNLAKKFTKLANEMEPYNLGIDYTLSNLTSYSIDDEHQLSMLKKIDDNKFTEENKIPLYFASCGGLPM